jgi:hypothetical protein
VDCARAIKNTDNVVFIGDVGEAGDSLVLEKVAAAIQAYAEQYAQEKEKAAVTALRWASAEIQSNQKGLEGSECEAAAIRYADYLLSKAKILTGAARPAADDKPVRSAEWLARLFHAAYEKHARVEGWRTKQTCQTSFDELPEANRRTMLATCADVLAHLKSAVGDKARVAELEAAIRWALGEGDSDFGDNIPPSNGRPRPFWWRTELRERAKLTATAKQASHG